nr:MAG TPA: hypothetical protein [Caudoviricetes sp.]
MSIYIIKFSLFWFIIHNYHLFNFLYYIIYINTKFY